MASWDEVEKDFGDDETGNFGPRVETGTGLYQVDTTVCINPSGEVTENPRVSAAALQENICIAADRHLSIFQDCGHKYLKTIAADNAIERVTFSEDGNFIVYGESDGTLHFIFVENQMVFFSQKIPGLDDSDRKCFRAMFFTPIDANNRCDLVVLDGQGRLHMINIGIVDVAEALQTEDVETLKKLKREISLSVIDLTTVHDIVYDVAVYTIPGCRTIVLSAGVGDNVLCMWGKSGESYKPMRQASHNVLIEGDSIEKIRMTTCGRYFIALDNMGLLTMWSTCTLTVMKIWKMKVRDFYLVDDDQADQQNDGDLTMKIIILTPVDREGSCELLVCKLSNMEVTYCLQLAGTTTLAQFPTFQENIFVIEGTHNSEAPSEFVSTLRMRCLSEALPEARFNRILHKKKFDEAEAFAKMFKLDVELVYKVKSYHLLDLIAPWNPKKISREDIEEYMKQLCTCLELIEEDEHVIDCCIKATPPTFESTFNLLNYARTRRNKSKNIANGNEDLSGEALLANILETLHRLATFEVAFGAQNFSADAWEKFLRVNMLKEFLTQLGNGRLETSFALWRRHQSEFERYFRLTTIDKILDNLPVQTESKDIKPWLKEDFIPYVMRHHPSGLEKIARWLEQKAKAMEMTEKDGWPGSAIVMCELLQTTCTTQSQSASERGLATPQHFATQLCNLSVGYKQVINKMGDEHNPFVRLHILLAQLRDLQNLHGKYKCHLSLDQYVKESTESLTYRMLDRVMALELIPSTIEKYVRPYMVEHGLNEEKMLFQYIGDLVERSYKMISYMGEAPWEAKAIAVISCIKDPDFKCRAVLRAMQQAYIPWTLDMENLVNAGLALDHPRVAEIKEQCRLYELRKMLIKYNLKNLDFYKSSTVKRLVIHIIKKDLPTAVEDALLITRTDKIGVTDEFVYMARIDHLLNKAKVWEILELLKSLPEEKAVYCARTLIERAVDCGNFCEDLEENEKVMITRLAVDVIALMLTLDTTNSDEMRQDYQHLLKTFQRLSALQVEFNEFLTLQCLRNEKLKENLLRQKVQAYFSLKSSNGLSCHENTIRDFTGRKLSRSCTWSLTRVFRFGELLGIQKDTLRGMLAIAAAARGEVSMALKMAREQFDNNETAESGAILYKVCHTLCSLLGQDNMSKEMVDNFAAVKELPAVIYQLTSKAVTVCRPELLADCIELCRATRLAMNVAHLCESGDYGLTVKHISEQKLDMTNQDPYKEWTFEPTIYKEDGLVMDSTIAMPLVYKYAMAMLPTSEKYKKCYPYCFESRSHLISLATGAGKKPGLETLNTSCQQVVNFLKENSQMELALQYSVDGMILLQCFHLILPSRINTMVQSGMKWIGEQLAILLMKVFNQAKVDHSLALGLCLSAPEDFIWERLSKTKDRFGQHFKKVMGLSTVAVELAKIYDDKDHLNTYEEAKKLAQCGYCLMKLKVSMKNVPGDIMGSKEQIISEIIRGKFISVNLVRELCSTFRIEEEHVLFMYMKQLLVPISSSGEESMKAVMARTQKQLAKAYDLTRIITSKEKIKETLLEIYGALDPYDYERIDFVLSRLNEIGRDKETEYGLELMTYLKAYKRVSEPSNYEETYRQATDDEQLMYDRSSLPPLAKERLPFHSLLDKAWPIISSELNEDTVQILLPVTSLLQLNQDHVYVTAIQNMINRYVTMCKNHQKQQGRDGVEKSKCIWDLQSKETEKLFEDIVNLLKGIKQLDTAMACMQWCIKVLPMGYDKVKALELSVHVAEAWVKTASGDNKIKATETHKKLTEFYRRSSTEQALFRRKLGEPRLLELSNKPAKLTLNLYEHPSIQQRGITGSNVQHLPDIHAAAEEITAINNLNLGKIHQALIEKWLPSTLHSKPDEADMTLNYEAHLNLDTTVVKDEDVSEDEVNLARVIYILQHGQIEKHASYLQGVAFSKDSGTLTMMCRVRALRCLFSLLDNATIEDILQTPMENIREYLQTLLYLVEFERLHVPHTEETFKKCNKEGLVRGIFRNHSHKPRAVRLVADICFDFDIHDTQLWNSILQQLMAFNMTEYLGHILVCLSGIPMLWQVKCVQNMWRSVLLAPLAQAVPPLSESQLDDCWKAANLLHRCPLLLDMDLSLFARHFLRVEMPICTLGCLLLVSEEGPRAKHLLDLFDQISCRDMLSKLNQHIVDTRVVPMISGIKDALFSHINSEKKFADIMTSPFARDFGFFAVKQKKIQDLLLFILRNKKLAEAAQLVKLYQAMNVSSPRQVRSKDPYADIRIYMREHGMRRDEDELLPAEIGVEEIDDYWRRSPVSSLMASP